MVGGLDYLNLQPKNQNCKSSLCVACVQANRAIFPHPAAGFLKYRTKTHNSCISLQKYCKMKKVFLLLLAAPLLAFVNQFIDDYGCAHVLRSEVGIFCSAHTAISLLHLDERIYQFFLVPFRLYSSIFFMIFFMDTVSCRSSCAGMPEEWLVATWGMPYNCASNIRSGEPLEYFTMCVQPEDIAVCFDMDHPDDACWAPPDHNAVKGQTGVI